MKSVRVGGKLFFLKRGESPRRVHFWADFVEAPLVRVSEAWSQYGRELGAAIELEWQRLIERLPAIHERGEMRLIRGASVYVPASPVLLSDAHVVEIDRATKGWGIDDEEVDRILDAAKGKSAIELA